MQSWLHSHSEEPKDRLVPADQNNFRCALPGHMDRWLRVCLETQHINSQKTLLCILSLSLLTLTPLSHHAETALHCACRRGLVFDKSQTCLEDSQVYLSSELALEVLLHRFSGSRDKRRGGLSFESGQRLMNS